MKLFPLCLLFLTANPLIAVGNDDETILESKRLRLGKPGEWEWEIFKDRGVDAEMFERRFSAKTNATEHTLRLRELHLAVFHDLPLISPRVEKVVTADHLRPRGSRAPNDRRLVVDDEAVVAGCEGLVCALERDELVAHIDERHPATSTAQLEAVHEASEELEHLVDVSDLHSHMVDADEPGHVLA